MIKVMDNIFLECDGLMHRDSSFHKQKALEQRNPVFKKLVKKQSISRG